jgi:hypothetical protein
MAMNCVLIGQCGTCVKWLCCIKWCCVLLQWVNVTVTSPFYLVHAGVISLPTSDNLRAELPPELSGTELGQRFENMKYRLQTAYKIAGTNIWGAHEANKKFYDRKSTII